MLCGQTISSRYEIMLVRYIGDFRKIAKYEIHDVMNVNKDQRLENLIMIPF